MWREMAPQLEAAHAALVARIDPGRTVLVGSTLAWHVRLAQETHAVPALTVHLSPVCIFSGLAPARLPGLFDLRGCPSGWVRGLHSAVERLAIDRVVAPEFDQIRRRLGLPPVRRVLSHRVNSPQGVACAWPADFAPRQADWPPRAETTGFPRWPAGLPQGFAPMAHDQFDNASGWVRQGVGVRFGRRGWARSLPRVRCMLFHPSCGQALAPASSGSSTGRPIGSLRHRCGTCCSFLGAFADRTVARGRPTGTVNRLLGVGTEEPFL